MSKTLCNLVNLEISSNHGHDHGQLKLQRIWWYLSNKSIFQKILRVELYVWTQNFFTSNVLWTLLKTMVISKCRGFKHGLILWMGREHHHYCGCLFGLSSLISHTMQPLYNWHQYSAIRHLGSVGVHYSCMAV